MPLERYRWQLHDGRGSSPAEWGNVRRIAAILSRAVFLYLALIIEAHGGQGKLKYTMHTTEI